MFSPQLTLHLAPTPDTSESCDFKIETWENTGAFWELTSNKPKARCGFQRDAKKKQKVCGKAKWNGWMDETGWHQREKRREGKLDSHIFSLGKNQVWRWDWARQLQQAAFTWHSPFINCYLAALRSHGPPSPRHHHPEKAHDGQEQCGPFYLGFHF